MTTPDSFPTRKELSTVGLILIYMWALFHWKGGVNCMQHLFISKDFRNHSEWNPAVRWHSVCNLGILNDPALSSKGEKYM